MNDSVWFSNLDWDNSKTRAHRVELDICWNQTGGNTLVFFEAFLENGFYVTIGLRQEQSGSQKAHMSVFRHGANNSLFESITASPNNVFAFYSGSENDKYCKGDYRFQLGEYYRLIISAKENRVTGYVYQWLNEEFTKIATFFTGEGSLIEAFSHNGVALEHFGMNDPCSHKSQVIIRDPLRLGVNGFCSVAKGGTARYQKCPNVNVGRDPEGNVFLSHGGDIIKNGAQHNEFVELPAKNPEELKLPVPD